MQTCSFKFHNISKRSQLELDPKKNVDKKKDFFNELNLSNANKGFGYCVLQLDSERKIKTPTHIVMAK